MNDTRYLSNWEESFASTIEKIAVQERNKAGALLPIIPDRSQWDNYLGSLRAECQDWKLAITKYQSCLLLLYAGLAFYEYDDNTFWPQCAKAFGVDRFSPNQQREINGAFSKAVEHFGLELKVRDNGMDFIGSAIHYIGIPLSLWDGFLDICEWALWREDWRTLSIEEWKVVVEKRSGSRQRLKKFLVSNCDTARSFVHEMLDARQILVTDLDLPINSIAQASILRVEYFDEVPETAEFLRPQNPESLFRERARLIWNEQRRYICVQLPGVEQEKLPATWHAGAHSQDAAHCPDALIMNSEAFHDPLILTLNTGNHSETQRLRGVDSWGLFDMESNGRLMNANRDELPLKSYTLVAGERFEIRRDGFDESESPINERFELTDGTTCYITRLWPIGKLAQLQIKDRHSTRTIRFKTRAKIDARFIVGKGERAAYFSRVNNIVKVEDWPILCVSIPYGYFRDNVAELAGKFRVFIDEKLAGGEWVFFTDDSDRQYYFWKWSSSRPVIEQVRSGTAQSLQELRGFFHAPALRGNRILSVKSPEFSVQYKIYKDDRKPGMGRCWSGLPGAFLPMFLLCQSTEGMRWDDLVLTKDVIAPGHALSYHQLRKYADYGYLEQRGHRWLIRQSRAELKSTDGDQCQLNYCGDPSTLWGLYRLMYHKMQNTRLPTIQVINKRGEIPYLRSVWPLHLRGEIERYLRHHHIDMSSIIWIR